MKYLVLYPQTQRFSHYHDRIYKHINETSIAILELTVKVWEEFDNKKEAIEFARQNKGVIVEAFEFDIKKTKDKEGSE